MRDPRKLFWLLLLTFLALGLRATAVLLTANEIGIAHKLAACLAGAAMVPVLAWIGWSLIPTRLSIGWCAAGAAAIYPPHVLLAAAPDGRLWTMAALAALLCVVLLPGWRATRRGAILAGCLTGVLIPLEPALAAAVPVFLILFWLAEGDVSWICRFTLGAAGRLGILVGVALLVAAPWLVHQRSVAADHQAAETMQNQGVPNADSANLATARFKAFFLAEGSAHGWPERMDRIGTIAGLICAAIGLYLSIPAWRTLWPSYAIIGSSVVMFLLGIGTAALRSTLEPIGFLWVAWTLSMLPIRGQRRPKIRVYRPGEVAHDPFEGQHVLHGPHYNMPQRRRAG